MRNSKFPFFQPKEIAYFKYCDLLVDEMWHPNVLKNYSLDKQTLSNHIAGLVQPNSVIFENDEIKDVGTEIGEQQNS